MQRQRSVTFWLGCSSAGIAGCLLLSFVWAIGSIPWVVVAFGAFQRRAWTCVAAVIMTVPTIGALLFLIGCRSIGIAMHGNADPLENAAPIIFGLFAVPFVILTIICFLTPVERR